MKDDMEKERVKMMKDFKEMQDNICGNILILYLLFNI